MKSWGRINDWFWYVSASMSGGPKQRVYVYRNLSTRNQVRTFLSPLEFLQAQNHLKPPLPLISTGDTTTTYLRSLTYNIQQQTITRVLGDTVETKGGRS